MQHVFGLRSFVLCLAFLFGATAPVFAKNCPYGVCFGVVAAGERGIAVKLRNISTAPEANKRAEEKCREKCSMIEVFHSGCGVIVQGGRKDLFSGFATTPFAAQDRAEAACELSGYNRCVVRAKICTD